MVIAGVDYFFSCCYCCCDQTYLANGSCKTKKQKSSVHQKESTDPLHGGVFNYSSIINGAMHRAAGGVQHNTPQRTVLFNGTTAITSFQRHRGIVREAGRAICASCIFFFIFVCSLPFFTRRITHMHRDNVPPAVVLHSKGTYSTHPPISVLCFRVFFSLLSLALLAELQAPNCSIAVR